MLVSVPLRGIGSEKLRKAEEEAEAAKAVSVPLRGIGSEKRKFPVRGGLG